MSFVTNELNRQQLLNKIFQELRIPQNQRYQYTSRILTEINRNKLHEYDVLGIDNFIKNISNIVKKNNYSFENKNIEMIKIKDLKNPTSRRSSTTGRPINTGLKIDNEYGMTPLPTRRDSIPINMGPIRSIMRLPTQSDSEPPFMTDKLLPQPTKTRNYNPLPTGNSPRISKPNTPLLSSPVSPDIIPPVVEPLNLDGLQSPRKSNIVENFLNLFSPRKTQVVQTTSENNPSTSSIEPSNSGIEFKLNDVKPDTVRSIATSGISTDRSLLQSGDETARSMSPIDSSINQLMDEKIKLYINNVIKHKFVKLRESSFPENILKIDKISDNLYVDNVSNKYLYVLKDRNKIFTIKDKYVLFKYMDKYNLVDKINDIMIKNDIEATNTLVKFIKRYERYPFKKYDTKTEYYQQLNDMMEVDFRQQHMDFKKDTVEKYYNELFKNINIKKYNQIIKEYKEVIKDYIYNIDQVYKNNELVLNDKELVISQNTNIIERQNDMLYIKNQRLNNLEMRNRTLSKYNNILKYSNINELNEGFLSTFYKDINTEFIRDFYLFRINDDDSYIINNPKFEYNDNMNSFDDSYDLNFDNYYSKQYNENI